MMADLSKTLHINLFAWSARIFNYSRHKYPLVLRIFAGGEGGIRTHERIAPLRDFQSRLFGHSSTSPIDTLLSSGVISGGEGGI